MVCGVLGVPACGDSITGGGAGLPGEPEGCPALVFARGFLILVSTFPRARARTCRKRCAGAAFGGFLAACYWDIFRA